MSSARIKRQSLEKIDLSRFIQSRLNLEFVKYLPDRAARRYIRILSGIFLRFQKKALADIHLALAHCIAPFGDKDEIANIEKKVEAGMADHYFEKILLACRKLDEIRDTSLNRIQLAGEERLQAGLAEGKGVLLVTGHYGGVELIPGALAFRGYPVTVMVHCKTPHLRQMIERQAEKTQVRLLDPKTDTVFFSVIRELRQGRLVITQCDEFDMWRPYNDRRINFLRVNLGLDKSLDLLARKSEAKVLFGLNQRRPGGFYDLNLEDPAPSNASVHPGLISEGCLSLLASRIEQHPEQWYEWKKIGKLIARTGLESTQIIRLKPEMADGSAMGRPAEVF